MKKIRCKFKCTSITETLYDTRKVYTPEFQIVTDGSEENKRFLAATPFGTLRVGTFQLPAFEVGKQYYVDIILSED